MNAIVIEQSEAETKLAFEVHQNAAIKRVRVARAKLASQALHDENVQISVGFNFKSKPVASPPDVLRLEIAFRMAGSENVEKERKDQETKHRVILVECAYEVDYGMRRGFHMTPEHVKAFKDGNAIFNTWPYFREFLQNNLLRMGLPPLTAPFLRLQPKPNSKKRDKPAHDTAQNASRHSDGR